MGWQLSVLLLAGFTTEHFPCDKVIEENVSISIPNCDFVFTYIDGIVVDRVYVFYVDDIGFTYSRKHIFGQLVKNCFDVHGGDYFLIFRVHNNIVFQALNKENAAE